MVIESAGVPLMATGWRFEPLNRGRYWQLRKGSGKNRRSIYYGKAQKLRNEYPERLNAYRAKAGRRDAAGAGAAVGMESR